MIIDNEYQLKQITQSDFMVYPIPEDDRIHPSRASIIAYALFDVKTEQSYIVSVAHPEGIYHINNLNAFSGKLYCVAVEMIQANGHWKSDMIDYDLTHYLHTNTIYEPYLDNLTQHYTRLYSNCHKINTLVPLLRLQDKVTYVGTQRTPLHTPDGYDFYNTKLKQSFLKIQANGLQVDVDLFVQLFGKTFSRIEDKCYTQYNYYTTTGRPSNRFGGINYAALPKEDSTRECFVSRFGADGTLLEIDFNAYHPHIIASIIGYDFKGESVYEHFAKLYNNTDNPNQQQIEKAKEDTFRQLYGGIRKDYLTIPFFGATEELSKALWEHIQTKGYVKSHISGRRLMLDNYKELTMHTLFNYFIQMLETEYNALVLTNVFDFLQKNKLKSSPVLYTYDSILFDVPMSEFDIIVNQMIPQCIDLGKFPIKKSSGNSYAKLEFINI